MSDKKGNIENLKNCNKYNIKLIKNTKSLTTELSVFGRGSFNTTAKSCHEIFVKIKL